MFNYEAAILDVKMEALANGLPIIANPDAIDDLPDIEYKYLRRVIDKAMDFAYNKRRGTNSTTAYPFSAFEKEANQFYSTIVNMAYTALTRRGSEGQSAHSENGISRTYTFSGLYLLSDVANITELAGV